MRFIYYELCDIKTMNACAAKNRVSTSRHLILAYHFFSVTCAFCRFFSFVFALICFSKWPLLLAPSSCIFSRTFTSLFFCYFTSNKDCGLVLNSRRKKWELYIIVCIFKIRTLFMDFWFAI